MSPQFHGTRPLALGILALVALLGMTVESGYAQGGGPPGGSVRALALDPAAPSTLYAGTENLGVFKSVNGGKTWFAINSGITGVNVAAIAVDPYASATLYAGIGASVFKSIDGGTSWTASSSGLVATTVQSLVPDPSTPGTLYAGTNGGGVFRSTDGGANWTAINSNLPGWPLDVRALAIDPSAPATLHAGVGGGVAMSTNGGASWTWTFLESMVVDLAIDPDTPSTLYAAAGLRGVLRSIDGGASWTDIGLANPLNALKVVIDPASPETLYVGTSRGGAFKSTDGGASWTSINHGLTGVELRALAIHPSAPSTVFAGTLAGVFKTSDGGGSWIDTNSGLTGTSVYTLAIDPSSPSTLYAGTLAGGVFKSMNAGASWFAVNTGLADAFVHVLAIDPSTPTTLYAGTQSGVFKSVDGGSRWIGVNSGLTPDSTSAIYALAIDPTNPSTLYAGGGGIFKSTNGGASWTAASNGMTAAYVHALVVDPSMPTIVYAGTEVGLGGGGVFKTVNAGATWTRTSAGVSPSLPFGLLNTRIYALAIDPASPSTLYAGGLDHGGGIRGIFKSINSAATWTRLSDVAAREIENLVLEPATATVYAGSLGYGVFKSSNGGASWAESNSGLTSTYIGALAMDPSNPATLYAGTYGAGVFKSVDAGVTWQPTGFVSVPAAPPPGITTRVSISSDGVQGNGWSTVSTQAMSTDGRYVAFASAANNLVPGDTNGWPDVFVRDRIANTTERVSQATNGTQANSVSEVALISGDGRYVTFLSSANNLVAGDVNGDRDVFVHDRWTGTTTLISKSTGGIQGNAASFPRAISADGRYVAFESGATNLVVPDLNGANDAFVHDRVSGTTVRVSVATDGTQGHGHAGDGMTFSGDARFVTFSSNGSNLVAGDTNGRFDVFVRDLTAGTTQRVSLTNMGTQGNDDSQSGTISADGRRIVFGSKASNLVAGDTNDHFDLFVRDLDSGTTTRVSPAADGSQGNGQSVWSSVSEDGRLIAFTSAATNLVPGDTNSWPDIFLHDRLAAMTTRVSVATNGSQGNSYSTDPAISGNGRFIAFRSDASNLVAGDTNGVEDVFLYEVSALQITTPALRSGVVNAPYGERLAVAGGRAGYAWSILGALPPGLAVNPALGSVFGVPTAAGTFSFLVTVTDSSSPHLSASRRFSISVAAAPALTITTSTLPPAKAGGRYGQGLAAVGGKAPYTWSIASGGLPGGLALNASAGSVFGTPVSSGIFAFVLTVRDSASPPESVSKALSISVAAPSVPLAPAGLALAWVNNQVRLSWIDASSDESGFKIERRGDPGGTFAQVILLGSDLNVYTDPSTLGSTSYCYRLRATNGFGDSPYSEEACIVGAGTDTSGQSLRFSSAVYTVPGTPGDHAVTIARTGGTAGSVTVNLLVTGGTAKVGTDYSVLAAGALRFAAGESSKVVTALRVLANNSPESRTVKLTLTGPNGAATLGAPSGAVMTIQGIPQNTLPGDIEMFDPVCADNNRSCTGIFLDRDPYYLSKNFVGGNHNLEQLSASRIGAVADGVTLLLLRVRSSSPVTFSLQLGNAAASSAYGTLMRRNGSAAGQSVVVEPEASSAGPTAYALFLAPKDLPASSGASLTVTASNSVGSSDPKPIALRSPPVVLVHGVWSGPSAFSKLAQRLPVSTPVVLADYSSDPAGSFDPRSTSVPIVKLKEAVDKALRTSRDAQIAASQVDVVAHSMGGLVARARASGLSPIGDGPQGVPYKRLENRNRGEFHKLITIGTPHRGTPAATFFVEHKCEAIAFVPNAIQAASLESVFAKLGRPIGAAIYQFQPGSDALANLRGAKVSTHTIAGERPIGSKTERLLDLVLPDASVSDILGQFDHDTIVPLGSQFAGRSWLDSATTLLFSLLHADGTGGREAAIAETTSEKTIVEVMQLLAAPLTDDVFPAIADQPSATGNVLTPSACPDDGLSLPGPPPAGSIEILPAPGTVVRPGDLIQVVFSVPADAGVEALISFNGGLQALDGAGGVFSLTYEVAEDASGDLPIFATTVKKDGNDYAASTYVTVLPGTPPDSLVVSPADTLLAVSGETVQLTVNGHYADGAIVALTSPSAGTTYTTQSGTNAVVSVSASGLVSALGNGEETIIIRNGGLVAGAAIAVNIANRPPTLTAFADREIRSGELIEIELTASDPDADSLHLIGIGLPDFATVVDNENGTGVLRLNPSDSDAGRYDIAVAVADDGLPPLGVSRGLRLTVFADSAPAVTLQPANQTVVAGENASFTVTVTGTPIPTLQWQVSVTGGSTYSNLPATAPYSGVTTPTLTVASATPLNGHLYRAVATNSLGGATSAPASLIVLTRILALSGDLAWGSLPVNATATRTLTIANTGTTALTVSGIAYPTGFSGNWTTGTIAAGSSQPVTVTFAPTAITSYSGNIIVTANQTGGSTTIAVSGAGVGLAEMSTPAPGSTLIASNVLFQWTGGVGATQYRIEAGSSPGGNNLFSATTNNLSATVLGLPSDNSPIYIRLGSFVAGTWFYSSYTYTASRSYVPWLGLGSAGPVRSPEGGAAPPAVDAGAPVPIASPAELVTPPPASTLLASAVSFQWTGGIGISEYRLVVRTANGVELFNESAGTQLSMLVANLPLDGQAIHVGLGSRVGREWRFNSYVYRAGPGAAAAAELIEPMPGSALRASTVQFTWTGGRGASRYRLEIGTTPENTDVLSVELPQLTTAVAGLPLDGRPVSVRLASLIDGEWRTNHYVYRAGAPAAAQLIAPVPGAVLAATTVRFEWTGGIGVSRYRLQIGTTAGGSDLLDEQTGDQLTSTVINLPGKGELVYARLSSLVDGGWQFKEYAFTAPNTDAQPAEMLTPAPSSALTASTVTFQWSGGIGVSRYRLRIGTTPGAGDLFDGESASAAATVAGLPSNGRTIFVSLGSLSGVEWQFADYSYRAVNAGAQPAELIRPAPESTLTASTVHFVWTGGVGVTSYRLTVGSERGGTGFFDQPEHMSLSATVSGLPLNGSSVHVRLWSLIDGQWRYNDYEYRATAP